MEMTRTIDPLQDIFEDVAPVARATQEPSELQVRFLDASVEADRSAWLEHWQRWPEREVMAHPGYVRLYARPHDRVMAAVARTARGGILYPFIARPLTQEPWCPPGLNAVDLTSAYG